MSKQLGADAKEVVLHFLERTDQRASKAIMGRTMNQAKSLMNSDYTKDEIIDVIDYIVDHTKATMHSFGYVNASINDMLRRVNSQKEKDKVAKQFRERVGNDDGSKERNRNKAGGFGFQSRIREKYNFDMFEGK